jgi:hypothetical protein
MIEKAQLNKPLGSIDRDFGLGVAPVSDVECKSNFRVGLKQSWKEK